MSEHHTAALPANWPMPEAATRKICQNPLTRHPHFPHQNYAPPFLGSVGKDRNGGDCFRKEASPRAWETDVGEVN